MLDYLSEAQCLHRDSELEPLFDEGAEDSELEPLYDRKPMGSVWSQPRIAGAVGLRLRWVVFWLRATVENVVFDSRMRSFCFKDG